MQQQMEKEVQDTTILENLELITSLEESFHEEATAVIPTTKNYNQNDNRFKLDLQTMYSHYKSRSRSTIANTITTPSRKQSSGAKLYMPISKESYMARLKTFTEINWFDKPKLLSPIECARSGWINVGEDWLECEYCGEKMLVKIPLYPDLENHLEKHYYEALTTAHSTFCPWREIPCEESIYKFPILSSEETIKEFQKRIINLIKLGEKIPKIKANINKNDDEEFIKSMDLIIPAEAKGIDSMVLKSAIYLSLFGWKYISKYGIDELLCDVCFRECSVNDYKKSNTNSNNNNTKQQQQQEQEQQEGDKENSKEYHYSNDDDVVEEILACKNEEEIWDLLQIKNNQVFNCEGEHYWYCLWIANGKQKLVKGGGDNNDHAKQFEFFQPGWSTTFSTILEYIRSINNDNNNNNNNNNNTNDDLGGDDHNNVNNVDNADNVDSADNVDNFDNVDNNNVEIGNNSDVIENDNENIDTVDDNIDNNVDNNVDGNLNE